MESAWRINSQMQNFQKSDDMNTIQTVSLFWVDMQQASLPI